ncbi:MAG: EAL domain-containing protein [Lachnospiraceae bacterium]|nr:EAL domain-containing protein [Lachnospiraceae bacterium]
MSVSGNTEDIMWFINKYPYFMLRFVIVVVIFIVFLVIIMLFRNRAYLRMVTDKDSVTGLMSWEKFKEDVETVIIKNAKTKYALIQFDIDKFKVVNDLYGIDGGNSLLRHIAAEIESMLDKNEMATRFYADVFCILISYDTDDEITGFISKISECIKNFTLIFGIYKIDEDLPVNLMIDRATFARNAVKGNSVKNYSFFDSRMLEEVLKEKKIESTMQSALDAGEFEVYLQPQFSVETEKIVSAEALVRWNDPIRKIIPPGEFIELFEKNNFITKLDVYMWEQVFKVISNWISSGKEPYPVSINVSAVHFKNRTIIDEITEVVKKFNIPLKYIELEITESTLLDDLDYAIDTIYQLHSLGFRIAMDDFGSGFSSLNVLNKLSIDVLKLDREFLNDASNSRKGKIVINDIITMAKHLNMNVVCEGVENREQVEYLKTTQCDKIQGFYYARPMSLINFEKEYY